MYACFICARTATYNRDVANRFCKNISLNSVPLFLHRPVLFWPSVQQREINDQAEIVQSEKHTFAILISFITSCFPSALEWTSQACPNAPEPIIFSRSYFSICLVLFKSHFAIRHSCFSGKETKLESCHYESLASPTIMLDMLYHGNYLSARKSDETSGDRLARTNQWQTSMPCQPVSEPSVGLVFYHSVRKITSFQSVDHFLSVELQKNAGHRAPIRDTHGKIDRCYSVDQCGTSPRRTSPARKWRKDSFNWSSSYLAWVIHVSIESFLVFFG